VKRILQGIKDLKASDKAKGRKKWSHHRYQYALHCTKSWDPPERSTITIGIRRSVQLGRIFFYFVKVHMHNAVRVLCSQHNRQPLERFEESWTRYSIKIVSFQIRTVNGLPYCCSA
jgi:hypothetical protein